MSDGGTMSPPGALVNAGWQVQKAFQQLVHMLIEHSFCE
jgi:hypothetical protein